MIEIDGEFFEDYIELYIKRRQVEKIMAIVQIEVLRLQQYLIASQPIITKFETGGIVLDPNFK